MVSVEFVVKGIASGPNALMIHEALVCALHNIEIEAKGELVAGGAKVHEIKIKDLLEPN